MANSTAADVHVDEVHWAFTTLSYLDTWCGATCHTVLRYVLRCLLVLALAGTFMGVLMRSVDAKRRAELKRKVGLEDTSSLLAKSKLGSLTESLSEKQMGVKDRKNSQVLSGGPDMKDSCAVM